VRRETSERMVMMNGASSHPQPHHSNPQEQCGVGFGDGNDIAVAHGPRISVSCGLESSHLRSGRSLGEHPRAVGIIGGVLRTGPVAEGDLDVRERAHCIGSDPIDIE